MRSSSRRKRGTISFSSTTISRRNRAQPARVHIPSASSPIASPLTFPERGARRDDLRPGLRVVGVARRVTIAFHISDNVVTIDRVLYGGRDLSTALRGGR